MCVRACCLHVIENIFKEIYTSLAVRDGKKTAALYIVCTHEKLWKWVNLHIRKKTKRLNVSARAYKASNSPMQTATGSHVRRTFSYLSFFLFRYFAALPFEIIPHLTIIIHIKFSVFLVEWQSEIEISLLDRKKLLQKSARWHAARTCRRMFKVSVPAVSATIIINEWVSVWAMVSILNEWVARTSLFMSDRKCLVEGENGSAFPPSFSFFIDSLINTH